MGWLANERRKTAESIVQLALVMQQAAEVYKSPAKLAEALKKGSMAARFAATFASKPGASDALNKAAGIADTIAEKIEKGVAVYDDFEAVVGIVRSLNEINVQSIQSDPEGAARNFGRLFVNVGEIADHIPGLGAYADFLKGFDDFFVNVLHGLDPASPYTPRGRKLQQAVRAADGVE